MKRIAMKQVHSTNVVEIGYTEELNPEELHIIKKCDGLITKRTDVGLIAYGADCAMVALGDESTIGICHAGWRGLVSGMLEKMLGHFEGKPHCFVGPFHHEFEILRDKCYTRISRRFGGQYFREENGILLFNFKQAVMDILKPRTRFAMDERSTFLTPTLASWRRDKKKGPGTQNRLGIYRDINGEPTTQIFLPSAPLVFNPPK